MEESTTLENACPVSKELDPKNGNGIPWLYIYLGFLLFKTIIEEIGLCQ